MNFILIASVLQFSIAANATGIGWGDTIIIKQQGIYKFITTYTDGKKNGKEYVLIQLLEFLDFHKQLCHQFLFLLLDFFL